MTVTYSDDDSADPNNKVTNVSEPVPTPAKKPKRPKNFQNNWLKEYNWLEFQDTKMYCSTCINACSLPNWVHVK